MIGVLVFWEVKPVRSVRLLMGSRHSPLQSQSRNSTSDIEAPPSHPHSHLIPALFHDWLSYRRVSLPVMYSYSSNQKPLDVQIRFHLFHLVIKY
jgi:hypothetical protein